MHYYELMGKIKNMKEKIFDGWWLCAKQSIKKDYRNNRYWIIWWY